MKAYLITSGTIFALVALLHVWKAIDERGQLATAPGEYLFMASLGGLAGALAAWAWRLALRSDGSLRLPPSPDQG